MHPRGILELLETDAGDEVDVDVDILKM